MRQKPPTEWNLGNKETLDTGGNEAGAAPSPLFAGDVPTATATTRHSEGKDPLEWRSPRRNTQWIFRPGDLLQGKYEILEVLGTGGMGQVFAAVDRQLDREVAIKACWPRVCQQVLLQEARALAALRHPGVVSVYGIGSHDHIDFMVMERLRGLTLHDHLEQRGGKTPFSVEDALDILIDIADALVVIHRAGLIHRDLKPSNIMLAPGNRTVLLDLGISLRSERVEKEAHMAGSPHYMAPEAIRSSMARGKGHLVDIYALGIIAFEMLAGKRPFEHHDLTRLLNMQLYTLAPRLEGIAKGVPLHLCRLVGEMIRKRPSERPQSVEVVSAWLRGIRRSQPGRDGVAPMTVLIADDDESMRSLLASFVEQVIPGVSLHLAADGGDALRCFHKVSPDALILDLDMPHMSGLELCMYLRGTAQAAATTIVAVSGEASPADRALLEHLGVARFINKSSTSEQILAPLVDILRSIHQTRLRVLAD